MAFNLGRISDGENRIRRDFVEFARLWQGVKEDWLDQQCDKFEKEHLSSLGPSLNRFMGAMHQFAEAVREAEKALQDDQRPSDELN